MKLVTFVFGFLPKEIRILMKDSRMYFLYQLIQNIKFGFGKNVFFSQTGEDELVLRYLPESYGHYVDIGAGQPVCGSNTYHFYKKGWQGICIDPITDNYRMLKLLRKNDRIMNCLVATPKGKMSFYEFVPYEYSTTVPTVAEKLLGTEGVRLRQVLQLDVLRLSEFAPAMDPQSPTFFSIDVEGADLEVLKSNDWVKTLPRVICIEELENAEVGRKSLIRDFLENYNYVLMQKTLLSSVFVHSVYLNSTGYRT
jgi:FkbM family methyltransferase